MTPAIAIFLAFAALVLAFIGTALWQFSRHNRQADDASRYLRMSLFDTKKGSK